MQKTYWKVNTPRGPTKWAALHAAATEPLCFIAPIPSPGLVNCPKPCSLVETTTLRDDDRGAGGRRFVAFTPANMTLSLLYEWRSWSLGQRQERAPCAIPTSDCHVRITNNRPFWQVTPLVRPRYPVWYPSCSLCRQTQEAPSRGIFDFSGPAGVSYRRVERPRHGRRSLDTPLKSYTFHG